MHYNLITTDKNLKKVLNNYNQDIIDILKFFQIKNIVVNIEVLIYNNFKREFYNYFELREMLMVV